jgi:hypothetical protein
MLTSIDMTNVYLKILVVIIGGVSVNANSYESNHTNGTNVYLYTSNHTNDTLTTAVVKTTPDPSVDNTTPISLIIGGAVVAFVLIVYMCWWSETRAVSNLSYVVPPARGDTAEYRMVP